MDIDKLKKYTDSEFTGYKITKAITEIKIK